MVKKEISYNNRGDKIYMSMRNMKRCISLLMAVVLLFFMLPLEKAVFKAAEPEEEISYREYDEENKVWNIKKCNNYQTLTDSDQVLSEGWYAVNGEVTCSNLLTVQGDVYLILTDECVLQAAKGIRVAEGNSLTIYAQSEGENMGKLAAKGTYRAAGIGGNSYSVKESNGPIIIHGGNITAEGGLFGAGIGGADGGKGKDIVIHGGIVTATGGESDTSYIGRGAGIGGAYNEGYNITINGGTVTATGGTYGAGIGGGDKGAGRDITINGGTVTATGGTFGAGIGGGDDGVGSNIVINGGSVTAEGKAGNCAGIGGGIRAEGTNITINGGTVDAKGSTGIGGGYDGVEGGGSSAGSQIYINGGIVKATGQMGAGIGGGGLVNHSNNGSDIHIKDAIVEATGRGGAGIGGAGWAGNGSNISITNSRVIAATSSSNAGAGIGSGGYDASGTDISITDSYVTASGGQSASGIGGGREGSGENISIEGSIVRVSSGTSEKAFIGGGDDGESINITKENSIIFEGNEGTVYGEAELGEELLEESIEVEIGSDETLTAPKGTSLLLSGKLTNNGTFTIYNESCLSGEGILGGDGEFILEYASFTADDIIVPEGMIYNGEDQTDYADNIINVDVSKYTAKIICDTEFTIQNVLSDEWKKSIVPAEVKKAGVYSAVYTNTEDDTSLSKEFKVAKSAVTYNDSENNTTLKSYEGNEEKNQFIYGSAITIKATPRLTGTAAQTISDELQANTYQEPLAGEIAVFTQKDGEEIQLTEAKSADIGNEVSFDINTLQQNLTPGTYTLSVRCKGTEDMADYSEDITVTVKYHEAEASAVLADKNKGENGWYVGAVTVEAPEGYLIASQNTEDAEWQNNSIEAKDLSFDENGDYIYYLKEESTGYLTDKMILEAAKIDDTKPEFGDFTYKEGKSGTGIFVKIWNWLVGKDYITVTVPITEAGSGLTEDNIQIHLTNPDEADTDSAVTAEEIKLTGDTEDGYTISFVIPADFDGYCSVAVKDTAGNESSSRRQRTVIDIAEPDISIKLTDIPYDETENIFENSAEVEISVDDSLNKEISAGLKTATYSFDEGASVSLAPEGGFDGTEKGFVPVLKVGEQIEIKEKGIHTLSVCAEDHAGNKTEKKITFQIYYSTALSLSEKEESGIYKIIYDGEPIEADTDFLVTRNGCEREIIYSYQCLDSEDNSYKDGLPTESGKYQIKAEIPQDDENFYFGAEATLELTIEKAQAEGKRYTIQVVKQKKHTISYDLSALLPKEVTGTTIYSITDINNEDGLLSEATLPSAGLLNGTLLSLGTEAAETAGKRAELTISFENANYEITNAVLIIETTDKIPVKISGVGILGMEDSQVPYSRSAVSYSGTPKAETEDGETAALTDSDYQYYWYQLAENEYVEIPDNLPPVDIGSYKLVVKVESNEYMGTQEIPFEIVKRDISDAAITLGEGLIFNGDVQTQTLKEVKAGALLLTEDEYIATENTGCEAGTYTLKITGTGNFTGTAEKEFTIAPLPVELSWNIQTFTYDGEIHSVSADVSNAASGYEVSVSAYNNESAVNAGTYTAQAAELDSPNYALEGGTNLSAEYTIEKLDITGRTDLEILLGDSLTYNGKVQTQEISSVKIGNLNVTCQISDNSAVNAGTYTLKITGDGNFTGTAKADFTILQAENAPYMPPEAMNTAIKDGRKVSDISLWEYTDWIWSTEDADKILPTTENESILVTVYYQGADKENYKNTSQQILITMIKCEHPEEQIDFFTDYEPTCTKTGIGHRYCKVCNMVIEENIEIDALGHSYGTPEFIWSEDFGSAEAVFICERGCEEDEAGHKKSLKAEVTAKVNGNTTIYTAEVLCDGNLYTDKKQVISKKEETRLQILKGIADIPESLKAAGYDTEEKIAEACVKMFLGQAGYQEAQKVMYDIMLQISFDGGETWEAAKEANFPNEGIMITLPYPEGTNAEEYDFIVAHMFSHTMNGFLAGEIEMPEVTKTQEGLQFVVKGLSPIMIGWKFLGNNDESTKKPSEEIETSANETDKKSESPATGDRKERMIWVLLCVLSAAELAAVYCSTKKKLNSKK